MTLTAVQEQAQTITQPAAVQTVPPSSRPKPLRRLCASRPKHNNWPLRVWAIIDIVITIGLSFLVGMVLLASAFVRGEGMEDMIIGSFFIWMLPHAFFSIVLVVAAKPGSITKILAVTSLVLNFLLMGAFWWSAYSISHTFSDDPQLVPDTVSMVFFKSLGIWSWQAFIAPIVIIIASFFESE